MKKKKPSMTDREMIDQWLVVKLGRDGVHLLSGDVKLDADCAVGFVYVDSMCGITFNVEAWCIRQPHSLRAVSRPGDTKQRIMLRYDTFAGKAMRRLTPSEHAALKLPDVPDWLSIYYENTEPLRALRALPLLDPLRAPGYPDDIQCLLYDKTGKKDGEWVWARLFRQESDDIFFCRLQNEPMQDFGVHAGEEICVKVSERPQGLLSICFV